MGVVYRARDPRLNRVVALKMVLAAGHAGERERTRFRAEAEAVARLQHANVVQIYEVGEEAGRPFLALEFCPGGTLARRLSGNPQPPGEAARIVRALAGAMAAAHAAGVLHRDLKPANVLLTAEGEPKVTDFGLAKILDADSGQTRTGAVIGTPSYMAPEQAAGQSRDVGPAADVYALGAILYELLTGRPPFKGASTSDTLEQVRSQDPVPPRRLQPRTPRDLETICLKCLEKEPARRYSTAAGLAEDLERFLDGRPIRARPIGTVGRALKWARRRPAAAGLAAVIGVAVAAIGIGGWVYNARLRDANASEREHRERAERALRAAEQAVLDMVRLTRDELARSDQTFLTPEADKRAAHAIATLERLVDLSPQRPELWEELGRLCYWRCRRGDRQDLSDRAVAAFEQAAALREARLPDGPDDIESRTALARTLHDLGDLHYARGEFDRGEESLGRSLDLYDALARDAPADRAIGFARARARLTRGRGAFARGQWSHAVDWTLRGAADLEADLASAAPHPEARTRLTDAYSVVANSHARLGDHRAAVSYWDRALADRVTLGPGRLRQTFQFGRAWSLAELGDYRRSEAEAAGVRVEEGALGPDWLVDLAALHARNARSVRADVGEPAADRKRLAEQLAARAVAALRSAHERKVIATAADLTRLLDEYPALRDLEGHADFDAFVRGLPP
jgi:tetratricopeptide (TPR) repeat protein